MKKFWIMFAIFIISMMSCNVSAGGEKKIVSIVYDDSVSMKSLNKYCYSDYALQILTASLEKTDKLNIVRMSNAYGSASNSNGNTSVDISTTSAKKSSINAIKNYSHSSGTPFYSVSMARDWLLNESKTNGENATYWLVVIADGQFENTPSDIEAYLSNITDEFSNLSYEFVFLGVGNSYDEGLKSAVQNSTNSTFIDASDGNSTRDALIKIACMINNGASDKIATKTKNSEKVVSIHTDYPLKKMIILRQNANSQTKSVGNSVVSINKSGDSITAEEYNVAYSNSEVRLDGSVIYVTSQNGKSLKKGDYEITFSNDVDLNDLTVLCEINAECVLKIVDEKGKELNSIKLKNLSIDDKVNVKCELVNPEDGSKLVVNNQEDMNVQIVNGKNKYNMQYSKEDNAYFADVTLLSGDNNMYAIANDENLIRTKSDIVNINASKKKDSMENDAKASMKIEVPYSSSDEYKKVSIFSFYFVDENEYNIAENFELQLTGLPDGIRFVYEGKEYGDNDRIPMIKEIDKTYSITILANKKYKEQEEKIVTLKIIPNSENSQIYWTSNGEEEEYLGIVPKSYPISVINKNGKNTIDVQDDELDLQLARFLSEDKSKGIFGYVDVCDIKKIKDNSDASTGYTYKVSIDKDNNKVCVTFTPNIFALFRKNKVNVNLKFELKNGIESADYSEEITFTNVDAIKLLMPYILGAVGFIIILGYFTKKKFNPKSQITITENGEKTSFKLKPSIATLLIPYVSHKTKIGMIEFRAKSSGEIVYSIIGLEVLKIDDETLDDYKEEHIKFNEKKIVMKKDISSVVINNYETEQKYEYLTKEIDISGYGNESTDDYSFNGFGDSSLEDDYTSDDNF